jgi:hypothetical protein
MNIESIEMISITIIFVILISLATFIIDKMNWWGWCQKTLFIMWNIVCAIFILLGTLVSLIFIVFTAMLFLQVGKTKLELILYRGNKARRFKNKFYK